MGIRISNVTKTFGDFHAIDGLSLDVASGSLVALLGPSGCGKSTLLRMIAGLEPVDQGQVFIIDPNKKLRLQITYPASTGRNFDEILRVIDSLQLTDNHSVATPVNWKDGQDCVVVPSIPTDEARAKFPKGVTEIRPYLRTTPQPNR